MTASRLRSLPHLFLLALAAALLAAGCGGGDGDGADTDAGNGAGDTGAQTDGDAVDGDYGEARRLFISSCGGCHTLSDADTSGAVGPNLDGTSLGEEDIRSIIDSGRGAMPGGLLRGEQADSVAAYVADVAGN
jgi:cytochrome c551